MKTSLAYARDAASRVLLVDDDGPILRALQARLKHAGYEVSAARDGSTALLSLADFKPDVAVLDINMPGPDGFTVAEKLRESFPDVGLLFLTASKAPDINAKVEALGGCFVEKPFDSKDLIRKIDELYG